MTATIPGVDLASFQGLPGTWRPEAGAIRWAGVKITELEPNGNRYVNPDAEADWVNLKAQGDGRVAYLFGHPATSPAAAVDFFAAELAALGLEDSDAVALDHEESDGIGPAQVAGWGVQVTTMLRRRYARRPAVYTFIDYALEGYCAGLGHHPLWISDPDSPAGSPRVPAPWKDWAMHQYDTSSPIDRDVARYATQADMAAALGRTGWQTWEADGTHSVMTLATATGAQASTLLRMTVAHFGQFPDDLAHYLDRGDLSAMIPAKARIRVPRRP